MNLSTNTVQLLSKLQWNFEKGDINQKSRLFANWTVLPFETCWLQRWGTSSTLNAINLVTSEYLKTNKNNGQQRQVFGLYDFYPVTSRNHYQTVSRCLYHVQGDRQLSSNMSIRSCESAISNPKCGCGVIFAHKKMWIKKKEVFVWAFSASVSCKLILYSQRFPDIYSSDIDFSTHRSLSGLSRHDVKWRGWFKLFF